MDTTVPPIETLTRPAARASRARLGQAFLALVLAVSSMVLAPSSATADPGCAGTSMYVVAHQDDTLLFTNPALLHDVQAGLCVRTVFVTAGDANQGEVYWAGREEGARAGYAALAGVPNSWTVGSLDVAGKQVRVETLSGSPAVSLVFMRLPEGAGVAGDGGSTYGFESIKKLWQGSIATIHAVDGSAAYTRAELFAGLESLMDQTQPERIVTQDYAGAIGDADNVDHHVTAYFTRAAHDLYPTPHVLVSYMGYGTTSLPQNVSGDDLAAKVNAFYAYTPYDPAICQTPTACATRPESEWLAREYIVASEDGGTAPGGEPANVAPSATATASSEDVANQETADKAIDGVAAGYPEAPTHEWSTYKGKAGSWLQLVWAEPQVVDSIVLYDRPNPVDQITAGTLTFSDGSEVAFGPLPNDGSSLTVDFARRTTTGVRLTVTSVLKGTANIGLAEIEVW